MDARDVKIVERGIKRAKEILGTTHNGETLSQIVDEWIKVAESNRFRQIRKAG
jgi:hypothetical protein